VKLNEFKKTKLNELDLSSFIGDYGSAAVRSGLGSLKGKNVLSTTDQMAKDQFVKNFTSRAFSGLESAISSGLVNPAATGKTSGANIGTTFGNNPAKKPVTNPVTNPTTQVKPTAGKNVSPTPAQKRGAANTAGANAFGQMANQLSTAKKSPEQIRQEKQAAATGVAQQQMANNGPFSKLPANQAAVQAGNIRQQKQTGATQTAQQQMAQNGPFSKLPANQAAVQAGNVRQQKQGQAATTAQDQMSPVSKLPADQFAKSADNVRQQQQTTATQTAQQQMTTPQGYQSSDPRYPNGKYDGVTGQPTPEYQKELDKSAAASAEKQKADAAASQAQSKSNDDMAANMNNIAAQRNMPNVPQPTTPKISTDADAEQAALDKMKQKNPKLAGMMAQAGLDDNLNDIKPDNTVQMPKRNKKPKGKAAESTRFDKLNYIFETILAEATMGQTLSPGGKVVGQANQQQSKQSISQYITNYFKQFMKGVNISDPSVTTQVATLAKELEQNYAKDKGKSTLPKLADLGWSVSHAQAEENPQQATTTPAQTGANPSSASAASTNTTPQTAQASTQQAKMTAAQITKLMQGLNTRQKQSVLKSLQAQLSKASPSNKKQVAPSKRIGFLPEENPPARNIQKQQK